MVWFWCGGMVAMVPMAMALQRDGVRWWGPFAAVLGWPAIVAGVLVGLISWRGGVNRE
jgi:hypothetical protein